MMQVPREAASFQAYVGVVSAAIRAQMGSSGLVVVVFDEPEILTPAKREEQARRDAGRTRQQPVHSEDIDPFPKTDNYTREELLRAKDCHAIVGCRAARLRFFDETGRQVLQRLQRSIDAWAAQGEQSVVLFDGLDPRGADRPVGAPRRPQIWGSDSEMARLFEHAPEGEGDLKLALVEERVRQIALQENGPLRGVSLHMTVTIDTDSIAIELLERGRRAAERPELSAAVNGVLCMRERSNKRDRWDDEDRNAVYWVVDYDKLFRLIQRDMWGPCREPSAQQERAAMALMVAGWAISGCDFADVKGLNAAMIFEVLPSMVKTMPETMELLQSAWSGDRHQVLRIALALKRLVLLAAGSYGERPNHRKATVQDLLHVDLAPLKRGAWTVSYWSGNEMRGNLADFAFAGV
jgi:hypothetical protein